MAADRIVTLGSTAASLWLPVFLDLAIKSLVVLAAAGLLTSLLRRASAAVRHLVWCVAAASLLLLPALSVALPQWGRLPRLLDLVATVSNLGSESKGLASDRVRATSSTAPASVRSDRDADYTVVDESLTGSTGAMSATVPGPASLKNAPPQRAASLRITNEPTLWLFLAWLSGAGSVLAMTVLGMLRLRLLSRNCEAVAKGPLAELVRESARRLGITRRVRLFESGHSTMPMTWGVFSSCLLLPRNVEDWSDERRRVVVLHELAHVKRGDFLTQLLSQAACMVYWFNPLIWFASRRIKIEREAACDDLVLRAGFKASDYAEHLLSIAATHGRPRLGYQPAIPMARRSQLEGRLLAVLDAKRNRQVLTRAMLAVGMAAMCLVSIPLAMLGTAAGSEGTGNASESATGRVAETGTENQKRHQVLSRELNSPAEAKVSVSVKVVDEDGNPLPGVRVFWLGVTHLEPHPRGLKTYEHPPVIVQGITAGDGTVRLDAAVEPEAYDRTILIARKEGLGFALRERQPAEANVVLELSPEVEIRGELYRPNGMPADGVEILVTYLVNGKAGWLLSHYVEAMEDEPRRPYWPATAFSDENGRFTLRGIPKSVSLGLELSHPDLSRDWLNASTISEGNEREAEEAADHPSPHIVHTLEPARPVTGVVRKEDTSEPFPGPKVTTLAMRQHGGRSLSTRCDAQGHYRIVGQLGDRYTTSVYPPGESGYLGLRADKEPSPGGNGEIEMNFSLPRGRLLRGKVVDADSGEPISKARIEYVPKLGNPEHRDELLYPKFESDGDGSFAITVIPGEGSLWVEGPSNEFMRVKQLNNRDAIRHMSEFPHAIVEVNVPRAGETEPVEVALRQGVTLEAQAVTPEGQPLPWVKALCPDLGTRGFHYEKGLFRFRGCDAAKTYRVFFLQPELHLGAVAELKYDSQSDGPIVVPLQPTAKVHGKVVTPTGEPASDAQVLLFIKFENDAPTVASQSDKSTYYGYLENMPDENTWRTEPFPGGEFHFENLVPGVALVVTANNEPTAVVPLGVGEDRDLGTIALETNQ